jgi:hypothetical protein
MTGNAGTDVAEGYLPAGLAINSFFLTLSDVCNCFV